MKYGDKADKTKENTAEKTDVQAERVHEQE